MTSTTSSQRRRLLLAGVLIVFALIVSRTVLRLWAERSREQLGARFKTKMVVGAVAISLLPVVFMFFMSYSLLNRTLARWFPRPIEIAAEQSRALQQEMSHAEFERLSRLASVWAVDEATHPGSLTTTPAERCNAVDAYWQISSNGSIEKFDYCTRHVASNPQSAAALNAKLPSLIQQLPSGAEVWHGDSVLYLVGHSPQTIHGSIYVARTVPNDFRQFRLSSP